MINLDYKLDDDWRKGFKRRFLAAFGTEKVTKAVEIMQACYPNVKYPTISHYLTGFRDIPLEFLFQVYAITGKSIHWLLTGEELIEEMNRNDVKQQGVEEFLEKHIKATSTPTSRTSDAMQNKIAIED